MFVTATKLIFQAISVFSKPLRTIHVTGFSGFGQLTKKLSEMLALETRTRVATTNVSQTGIKQVALD